MWVSPIQHIIRDYPFARQTVWQFGCSLLWRVQTVNMVQSRANTYIYIFTYIYLYKSIFTVCFIACVVFHPSSQSVRLYNFSMLYLWQLFMCCGALRVPASWAGDKELPKEGHHTASGAITRMTAMERPPLPPPAHVCPTGGGWGISKGGAWEAISVIPSPSYRSCQLGPTASKFIHVFF